MIVDDRWYKDAVLYELHVKAFQDDNGDGIGDFRGLTTRLDYLQRLGVDCLWLLPFYPSPLKDDGYDISDYYGVSSQHTPPIPENCQWCLFLRNHDELTLEMCTDPERDYMYYLYAQDPLMKLNIGISSTQ
jgi:hypothetical protein